MKRRSNQPNGAARVLNPLARAEEHWRAGRHDLAYGVCVKLLERQPKIAKALGMLGAIDLERARFGPARAWLVRACEAAPHSSVYRCNLGLACYRLGDIDEAVKHLQSACELEPSNVNAFLNLGLAHLDGGRIDVGIRALGQACKLSPYDWNVQLCFAKELVRVGIVEPAMAIFARALHAEPLPLSHCVDFIAVLHSCDRYTALLDASQTLVSKAPAAGRAQAFLGSALARKARYDAAVLAFRSALDQDATLAWWVNPQLASALSNTGRVDEAIDYLRPLCDGATGRANHSEVLLLMNFSRHHTARDHDAEARRWNEQHALVGRSQWMTHVNSKEPERRLRIGYVSPHFKDHVLHLFLLPLFRAHDRGVVEVLAYSAVQTPDLCTKELAAHVDTWRDVSKLDERGIAALVHEDRVDILVDLSMHVAGSRVGAFTYKPAPVQVCWLAYPGTTGLEAMDYRITDPHIDPEGHEAPSTEMVLRLPDSIWCYDPDVEVPDVNALPATGAGVFTFGALNIFAKVNTDVLECWAQVLVAVPNSRLLLYAPKGWARDFATGVLAEQGVNADRLTFVERQGRMDYLATFQRIDLFLDTFPYGGHTTVIESFLMGVPAVITTGDTPVSRGGASVAANLGLSEFVAHSPEDYVRIACHWANDLVGLASLRARLRDRVRASPLMEPARFARNFEDALRGAWRKYCAE